MKQAYLLLSGEDTIAVFTTEELVLSYIRKTNAKRRVAGLAALEYDIKFVPIDVKAA